MCWRSDAAIVGSHGLRRPSRSHHGDRFVPGRDRAGERGSPRVGPSGRLQHAAFEDSQALEGARFCLRVEHRSSRQMVLSGSSPRRSWRWAAGTRSRSRPWSGDPRVVPRSVRSPGPRMGTERRGVDPSSDRALRSDGHDVFRERDRSVDRSMSNESHPSRWLRQSMGMGPPPHVVPQAMF
jgi:hypothetical protein